MRQKFAQKLSTNATISIYNAIIEILFFNLTHFCVSQRKAYLGTMISSKEVVIEPAVGVNEEKNLSKIS